MRKRAYGQELSSLDRAISGVQGALRGDESLRDGGE